jgi:hypothetical protein
MNKKHNEWKCDGKVLGFTAGLEFRSLLKRLQTFLGWQNAREVPPSAT